LRGGIWSRGGFGFRLRARQARDPLDLEALQLFERAMIDALAGIDHPLEALEGGRGGGEGVAGGAGRGFGIVYEEGVGGVFPELGFDAAQAAEAPFVVYKRIDEETLAGIGGAVMFVIFGCEIGEIFGGFVEHDLGSGEDAVLDGVAAGCGFPCGSARPGRFLRIHAVRSGLFSCWHKASFD
jgi:hypothetical protein